MRDLQADLSEAQPGNMLLSINGILIRGSGKLDEISLLQQAPDSDSDEDGITDSDEINIYLTDPTLFDTDGDGLPDGVELNYWAGNWGADNDADGLYNISDSDSDNDGVLDGDEIAAGTNPGVADMLPPTVYEDAEDGNTLGWSLYDDDPVGALINNVFDQQRQSRVVEFIGAGNSNGYILFNDQFEPWNDSSKFVLQFAMKFEGYFTVTAKVRTTLGFRYLSYNPKNTDNLSSGSTITHGIGFDTRDDRWRTVTRNLQQDLVDAQPGNQILEVDALIIRGNGRVDDIGLYDQLPAVDSDMDGISDNDEIAIYGTNPTDWTVTLMA